MSGLLFDLYEPDPPTQPSGGEDLARENERLALALIDLHCAGHRLMLLVLRVQQMCSAPDMPAWPDGDADEAFTTWRNASAAARVAGGL
jgi:hypothetical protein